MRTETTRAGAGLRGGESLTKFRVAAVAIVFFLVSLTVAVFFSPLASAGSVSWTTDTDFNGGGAVFIATEVVGTGVPARVDLLKDTIDWKNENPPGSTPGALDSPASTFDSKGNVTVLFGGYKGGVPNYSDKTWEYAHGSNAWTEITTTPKPPARQSAGLSYDPGQHVVVLFGGFNDTDFLTDTWEYNVDTNTWAQITPSTSPPPMVDSPLVYHATAQKHILFGQSLTSGSMETWAYDAGADTWTNRNPTGSPSTRSGFALAYSPQRQRTVLFGGSQLMTLYDQTFEYNYALNSWSQISVSGPAARAGHSMTYRPASQSVVLFGGGTSSGTSQETWRYFTGPSGPTWQTVSTNTKPPARQSASFAFDTLDDVAVLYGGISGTGSRLGDTWTLGAAYRAAGKYTSPVGDSGGFPTWGTLWWNKTPANQPPATFLWFQIATSTSPSGPWNYVGENYTPNSYYKAVGQTINSNHNGQRYIRLLVTFGSTDTQVTPSMQDVTINFNIPPAAPCIVSTDPGHLTFGVSVTANVIITFSEAMDPLSVTVSFLDGVPITFTFNWNGDGSILNLTHPGQPFAENAVYTLKVDGKDLSGVPLSPTCPGGGAGAQNPFTFVTEKVYPTIQSTDPPNGTSPPVPWAQPIVVQFSEGMDPFSLVTSIRPNNVVLDPVWSNGDATLTLNHAEGFSQCTPYRVQINATDKAHLPLVPGPVPNPWTFLAFCDNPYIVSTSPRNVETEVALNAPVTITFSEPMMRSSLSFTISPEVGGKAFSWSTGDTVLTMTHSSQFTGCTVYTVTIAATDLEGKPLIPNPIDSTVVNPSKFITTCANPYILKTVPADQATGVSETQEVRVYFSEEMVPDSVTYTITPTATLVSRSWDANVILHLSFIVLNQCTQYKMNITGGTDMAGNSLVAGPVPNPWVFDIVCNAPYLTSEDPAAGAGLVPVDKTVVVTFNKAMNTGTVVTNLQPPDVTFTRSWSNGNTMLTLTHSANFVDCRRYRLGIDGKSEDNFDMITGPGAPGLPNPFDFTTRCAGFYITNTDPSNQQPNVPRDHPIVIDFSEAATQSSFRWTLKPNTDLSAVWSNGDTRVTLTHDALFPECVTHNVTVTAFNATGSPLINVTGSKPNPWTFKTACAPPQILVTDPVDGASGVALTARINVTFSRPMQRSTVFVSISPSNVGLTQNWLNGDTFLTLTHSTAFTTSTRYTVQVRGNDVDGGALVAGLVPNPWNFTTAAGVAAPRGLQVIRAPGGSDIILRWQGVPVASSYVIYSAGNRFARWPWPQLTEVSAPTTSYTATGQGSDGATHYYIVRAKDPTGILSGNSTMGVKAHLSFAFNAGRSNINWMSIPYRSIYQRASDISNELTSTRIDVIGKWDPQSQSIDLWFFFRGSWRGDNFALSPGDGFYIGIRSSFTWVVNGTDGTVGRSFTFYPPPNNNVNWISLPYTNPYLLASDLVRDIEGGLGPGTNTKIIEVAKWDPLVQALVRFSYTAGGWSGTDFLLGLGDGVYLRVVATFTWTPRLLTPEVP